MANDSPAVILYDGNSNPLAVENGVAIPANTRGTLFHGRDASGDARVAEFVVTGGINRLRTDALTQKEQFEQVFTDEMFITVTHNLGLHPLNVYVLATQQGVMPKGSFGQGGFGDGGFGDNVASPYLGNQLLTGFTLIHQSENQFTVNLPTVASGYVIYWI